MELMITLDAAGKNWMQKEGVGQALYPGTLAEGTRGELILGRLGGGAASRIRGTAGAHSDMLAMAREQISSRERWSGMTIYGDVEGR